VATLHLPVLREWRAGAAAAIGARWL